MSTEETPESCALGDAPTLAQEERAEASPFSIVGIGASAGVLVSETLDILQFRGLTSPYQEPAPGTASLNLLKMAREGLFVELKSALEEAKKENRTAERKGVQVRDGREVREVNLQVVPVTLHGMNEGCFLVLFGESVPRAGLYVAEAPRRAESSGRARFGSGWLKRLFGPSHAEGEPAARPAPPDERDRELIQLRRELAATKERQQHSVEQRDAANEELKSAKEEILSLNDELGTAKEELQSVNKVLMVVNEQLQNRNDEAKSVQVRARENDDFAQAIVESVREPLLILTDDLRVKLANVAFYQAFRAAPEETEGRFIDDLGDKRWDIPTLKTLLEELLSTGAGFEDFTVETEFPGVGHRAMLLNARRLVHQEGKAGLILLSFEDVADRTQAEDARVRLAAIVDSSTDAIIGKDLNSIITSWNEAATRLFGYTTQEAVGRSVTMLIPSERPDEETAILEHIRQGRRIEHFETVRRRKDGTLLDVSLTVSPILNSQGQVVGASKIARDITERRRAEARIQASEVRYRRLFESARDGILMLDFDTRKIIDVNPFMSEFLGYTRDEFLGKELWEIGLFGDQGADQAAFRELRETGYLRYEDLPLQTKQGMRREVDVVSNLYSEDGPDVIQCNIRDVTERKRVQEALQRSEEQYRTLFTSIDEGFCVFEMLYDEDGQPMDYRFVEVNPAFEKHTGLKHAEGKTIRELVPSHEQYWFDNYGQVVATGEAVRVENRAEGLNRWFDVYAFRLGGPESRRVAAIFSDVTDRKRAEQALKDADRRKNEFLAMLAHELRNPLSAISNAVELSNRAAADSATAEWGRDVIKRQVGNLSHLVSDLMDVSRINQGKVRLRKGPVELGPIISRAVAMVRHHIDGRKHELQVSLPHEPVWLDADPTRLEQVFANLLNNAAKYTEPGGRIAVLAERREQEVVIAVKDTGVGISPEMLQKVFDLFTQVERSSDRSQGGLGIGLTVVRSLVEMHGGSVSASSTPGEGSVFAVRLPVIETPAAERPESAVDKPTTAPRRILIVDDNPDTAQSMAWLLKHAGHRVEVAHDGRSAIDAARDQRPDIMLLDIGLPGMDGYGVARRIRQDEGCKDTVIIGMSGYSQEDDRRRSREAGFNHHLAKPVDYESLIALINGTHSSA
jgi:PAS domain S-box-containing protein